MSYVRVYSVHVHSLHIAYKDHSLRSSRSLLSKVLIYVIDLNLQALQDLLWVTRNHKISTSTRAEELMTPGILKPAGPGCQLYTYLQQVNHQTCKMQLYTAEDPALSVSSAQHRLALLRSQLPQCLSHKALSCCGRALSMLCRWLLRL